MCLAIPLKVCEVISLNEAVVEIESLRKKVNTSLVDDVCPGKYLIVHAGYAIQILNEEEAIKTIQWIEDLEHAESE